MLEAVRTPANSSEAIHGFLKARVHGIAFQCQDSEDALVHTVERLMAHKALKSLDAESELAQRK